MAFLDNSGDIILDAVITDTGRFRLAKGDGSFKIVKYALGDDEIDYGNYNKNHASGSAYYDLEILQTPVLEAFTNNTSTMKSKLISIPRTNLLYLPVIKLFTGLGTYAMHSSNIFVIGVDDATIGNSTTGGSNSGLLEATGSGTDDVSGILNGFNPNDGGGMIRVDEGLDTTEIPASYTIDADLNETQYIIEIDNRLGAITRWNDGSALSVSFIDDDNVASYFLSLSTDTQTVHPLASTAQSSIAGPRGTTMFFKVRASTELQTSTYLFEKLGSSDLSVAGAAGKSLYCRYIDSIIKITGATTGYRVDVPVRFVKKQNQ